MQIEKQPELAIFHPTDIMRMIREQLYEKGYYVLKYPTIPQFVVEVTKEAPATKD